jgi:hypothetical protein
MVVDDIKLMSLLRSLMCVHCQHYSQVYFRSAVCFHFYFNGVIFVLPVYREYFRFSSSSVTQVFFFRSVFVQFRLSFICFKLVTSVGSAHIIYV